MKNTEQPAPSSTNVAGATPPAGTEQSKAFASQIGTKSQVGKGFKAYDAKATRWMASHYKIHASELESLSIVYAYLELRNKSQIGTNQQDIVNWSGYLRKWKVRVYDGIERNVQHGFLERIPFGRGFRVRVTHKGMQALEAWINRLNEIMI